MWRGRSGSSLAARPRRGLRGPGSHQGCSVAVLILFSLEPNFPARGTWLWRPFPALFLSQHWHLHILALGAAIIGSAPLLIQCITMCVCVPAGFCVYVWACVCVYACTCVCFCVYMHMHVCLHLCVYMYVYMTVYVVYVRAHVCMHVHVCVFECVHIHKCCWMAGAALLSLPVQPGGFI